MKNNNNNNNNNLFLNTMNLYEPLDINNILNNDSLDLISKQKRLEDIQIDSRITSKNIIQTK